MLLEHPGFSCVRFFSFCYVGHGISDVPPLAVTCITSSKEQYMAQSAVTAGTWSIPGSAQTTQVLFITDYFPKTAFSPHCVSFRSSG